MRTVTDVFYIIVLGLTMGANFALAAFVAPAIFHSELAFGREILSHFQEGLVMTAVFEKYCVLLNITVLVILLKEAVEVFVYHNRDLLKLGVALVAVTCSLLFTLYFTPEIVHSQAQGPQFTRTEDFQAMHRASVVDFSFILVSLAALMAKTILQIKSRR